MPPVRMVDPVTGDTFDISSEEVAARAREGWRPVEASERYQQLGNAAREETYGGAHGKIGAAGAALLRGGTAGLSDVVIGAAGGREDLEALRDVNPGLSAGFEVGGALLGAHLPTPAAAISSLGADIAETAEGASALTRIGRAAGGAAVEGGLYGAGSGVSEVALSKDPVTLEGAISSIGSSALFGGAVGGATGLFTKAAGMGLRKAQSKLDDIAAAAANETDDAAKVALRDEVATFRKEMKGEKPWLAAKDTGIEGLQTVGKRTLKADKALDNLLDDPKALIDNPKAALRHLRVQEAALNDIVSKSDEIRTALTAQKSTQRLAALEKVAPALERNRALQAKIGEIIAAPVATSKAAGIGTNMLGGQAFGIGASIASAIPGIGPLLAPMAGAAASKLVTEGFGKMAAKTAARASKAIDTFMNVAERAPNVAPVLASKILTSVKFSEGKAPVPTQAKPGKAAPRIAAAYKARTDEIKQLTQYGPDGKTMMRPESRAKMATHFDEIRHIDPIAADQAETLAARRITAYADRIPRKPDVMALSTGPDKWQPSDMQMRGYARFVAAGEDPIGVVERLSSGTVTPEDRDAFKTIYPEMYAQIQQQILAQLPTLKKTLPYQRRLALSVFSGMPVDPAMHPRILEVLQSSFTDEPGTEGGTQAPQPQPQFGSVKNQEATPSEARQGLET